MAAAPTPSGMRGSSQRRSASESAGADMSSLTDGPSSSPQSKITSPPASVAGRRRVSAVRTARRSRISTRPRKFATVNGSTTTSPSILKRSTCTRTPSTSGSTITTRESKPSMSRNVSSLWRPEPSSDVRVIARSGEDPRSTGYCTSTRPSCSSTFSTMKEPFEAGEVASCSGLASRPPPKPSTTAALYAASPALLEMDTTGRQISTPANT